MSYILDALRRADAERERDPARGIHAQPSVVLPAGGARPLPPWAWAAAAAAMALTVAFFAWPDRAVPPAGPIPPPAAALQPLQELPAPAAPVATRVAAEVSPPAPPPLPRPVAAARPAAERAPVERTAAAPVAAASTPPAALPVAAPQAGRILAVAELPPDVQRELPKLAISGGVHSENAAQRLLIVGGQVMNEGAELAPGVVLEQIRARNAVLRFRGFRYSVPF